MPRPGARPGGSGTSATRSCSRFADRGVPAALLPAAVEHARERRYRACCSPRPRAARAFYRRAGSRRRASRCWLDPLALPNDGEACVVGSEPWRACGPARRRTPHRRPWRASALRFAKRGRLRFLSHRDVARSFERAVRRAGLPVAHSHGFTPHPRLSWIGAAPTGAASEAEYVEIGLTEPAGSRGRSRARWTPPSPTGWTCSPRPAAEGAPLADRIDASEWRIELPGVAPDDLRRGARRAARRADAVVVERVTPSGRRQIDVRAALVDATGGRRGRRPPQTSMVCAILTAVVRQTTPAVRPDDVLGALDVVADLRPPVPREGNPDGPGSARRRGALADPLGPDRVTTRA